MRHEPSKARRIGRSAATSVAPRHFSPHRDVLLGVAVGLSMLAITGGYAATLRYQPPFRRPVADFPRWTALDGLNARVQPVRAQLDRLKAAVARLAGAQQTRAETAAVLKRKIAEHNASATETPPTP